MSDRTPKTLRTPPRGDLFDQVWGMVQQMVADALSEALPTMGTVVGKDGGAVKVRMDDEDSDREVGFPAAKGTDYRDGDRVAIHQTKGGERMILGRVDSSTNEAAVDSPQLRDKAIRDGHLNDGAVTGRALENSILNKINGALQSIPGDVVRNEDLKPYAKQSDIPSVAGLAKDSRVDSLETRIDRLEKRIKR